MRTAITLVALVLLPATSGRAVSSSRVSEEEKAYLEAAFSRLTVEMNLRKRRAEARVEELRESEAWANRSVENAVAARRDAEAHLRRTQQAELAYGSPAYTESPAVVAAENELQQMAQREDEARRERESRAWATAVAQREAAARSQADRARQAEMAELIKQVRDTLSGELAETLEGKVIDTIVEWDVRMVVTWRSSPENRDALIYYQTKRGRERGDPATSLGNPTETTEALPMGRYYVWATRQGHCTSDVDRLVRITKDRDTVTVVEDRRIKGGSTGCPKA